MHNFNVHSSSVYRLQPTNCVFDPPTRSEYSCDSGSSVSRCSSVMPLFASPSHQAPTMYAAAVSREYMTCDGMSQHQDKRDDYTNSSNTHEVVVELEAPDTYHSRARNNPQCDNGNAHAKEGECLSRERVSHLPSKSHSTAIEGKVQNQVCGVALMVSAL